MNGGRLGLVLAGQRLGQLRPPETREALFGNVGNLVCFQMGEVEEAQYLARHLRTPGLTGEEIRALGRYEVYAQTSAGGIKRPAFWARTLPAPAADPNGDRLQTVVEMSRGRYALPRRVVEESILVRERDGAVADPEKRRVGMGNGAADTARPTDHPGARQASPDDQAPDSEAVLSN